MPTSDIFRIYTEKKKHKGDIVAWQAKRSTILRSSLPSATTRASPKNPSSLKSSERANLLSKNSR